MEKFNISDISWAIAFFEAYSLQYYVFKYMYTEDFMLLSQLNSFDFANWLNHAFNERYNQAYGKSEIFINEKEVIYCIAVPHTERLVIRFFTTISSYNKKTNKHPNYVSVDLIDLGIEIPTIMCAPKKIEKNDDFFICTLQDEILNLIQFAQNVEICPKCHGFLISKQTYETKNDFWGCNRFPKCKYIKAEMNTSQKPNVGDVICPKCGGKMILRTASKGYYTGKMFWGCSGYPVCKSILKYEGEDIKNKNYF